MCAGERITISASFDDRVVRDVCLGSSMKRREVEGVQ